MRKRRWIAVGLLLAGMMLVVLLGLDQGRAPGVILFFGRFHPLVVHFPIALLLLAAVVELLAPRFAALALARPSVPFLLALGAASALAAVALGLVLSLEGGYEEGVLSLHQWLGLAVAGLSTALAFAASRPGERGRTFRAMLGGLAIMVILTGHFGATMTRGGGYLTYHLPSTVQAFFGLAGGGPVGLIADIDSARVYADLIQPVFERRCTTCHGPNKSRGDLRLDTQAGVEKGGRDGPAFVAGNPAQSEILRRITLPPHHEDAMPPDGSAPLDVGETELVRWWIAGGASFDARVAEMDTPPTAVTTYLARVSQPRGPQLSGIMALDVPEPDSLVVAALVASGLVIRRLSPDAPFLEISAANVRDRFADTDVEALRPVAAQISVLDLARTQITDAAAANFAAMPHLTHLHLNQTSVTDGTLTHLDSLAYLEYLNLYGTSVGDAGVVLLQRLPSLRAVYLWQTNVTDESAAALRRARPGVDVNTGGTLASFDDPQEAAR